MDIGIKRAYERPARNDGTRVLVDRVWPRGVTKEQADIALWLKDIAPSTELRKWFAHDPDKWPAFKTRYLQELRHNNEAVARLLELSGKGKVTLVYAARDHEHNNAVALKEYLEQHSPG
ncbi:MAG TPA: DUF488 domain-containing protein [Gammaproteobacteria bacterium]|nr:DUF488 domain-containing protein [Gammaproteobacteria bacterium]